MSHQMAIETQSLSKMMSPVLGLLSVILAAGAGFGLGLTVYVILFSLAEVRLLFFLVVSLPPTAGLTAASIWLARRSQISGYWIGSLMVVAENAGFVLFWFLLLLAIAAGSS